MVLTRHLTNCSASLIISLSYLFSVNHELILEQSEPSGWSLCLPSQRAEQSRAQAHVRTLPCISLGETGSVRLPSSWGR